MHRWHKFNEELKDIFIQQTRLQLVNNNADLEIDGEITGYNQYNKAVSMPAVTLRSQADDHSQRALCQQYES